MASLLLPELLGAAALATLALTAHPVAVSHRIPRPGRDFLLALGGILAGVIAVAMIVHAVGADDTYQRIVPFDGASENGTMRDALGILIANLRVVLVCLAAGLAVAWTRSGYPERDITPGRQMVASICDGLLAMVALVNVAIIGIAVGAYGTSLASSLLPHALVELPAFAMAAAAYLRLRSSQIPVRVALLWWMVAAVLLVPAALLETFVG